MLDDLSPISAYSVPTVTTIFFGNINTSVEDIGIEQSTYSQLLADFRRFDINTILNAESTNLSGFSRGNSNTTRLDPGGIGGG